MAQDTNDSRQMPDLPADSWTEAELGDWMHAQLAAEYGNQTEDWATERVGRITSRLDAVRASCPVRGACSQDLPGSGSAGIPRFGSGARRCNPC